MAEEKKFVKILKGILNFRFPLLLRIPIVLGIMYLSVLIAPKGFYGGVPQDTSAYFLGGALLFWIIYFVFQCAIMERRTESDFLETVYRFLFEKGFFVAFILSLIVVGGSVISILSQDASDFRGFDDRYGVSCAIVYPSLTWLLATLRYKIAAKKGEIYIADGAVKYWGPFVLSPILSGFISRVFLENFEVARVISIIIAGIMVVDFILSCIHGNKDGDRERNKYASEDLIYGAETKVTGMHRNDVYSHVGSSARWIDVTNRIKNGTYYITGEIEVRYVGDVQFVEERSESLAEGLIDRMKPDIRKMHPECGRIDASGVKVSIDCHPL